MGTRTWAAGLGAVMGIVIAGCSPRAEDAGRVFIPGPEFDELAQDMLLTLEDFPVLPEGSLFPWREDRVGGDIYVGCEWLIESSHVLGQAGSKTFSRRGRLTVDHSVVVFDSAESAEAAVRDGAPQLLSCVEAWHRGTSGIASIEWDDPSVSHAGWDNGLARRMTATLDGDIGNDEGTVESVFLFFRHESVVSVLAYEQWPTFYDSAYQDEDYYGPLDPEVRHHLLAATLARIGSVSDELP